ncbi:hypothetical protein [Pontibacter harenae]|uniref:hypothetical protein n=1 Tax=Pontibacter harenae TaxID=2894083 RepID=UPI001E45A131|nr:hypothetical protein [Pontibacter harenae]MCC9165985.1 hypothetical protein [Pontibacter harenae]
MKDELMVDLNFASLTFSAALIRISKSRQSKVLPSLIATNIPWTIAPQVINSTKGGESKELLHIASLCFKFNSKIKQ